MSKNNTIRKSDKKFIRLEKARIRTKFLDLKKQEEMITELYARFIKKTEVKEAAGVKEVAKEAVKPAPAKVAKKKVQKAKS